MIATEGQTITSTSNHIWDHHEEGHRGGKERRAGGEGPRNYITFLISEVNRLQLTRIRF